MPNPLTENSFQRMADGLVVKAEDLTLGLLEKLRKLAERLINTPGAGIDQARRAAQAGKAWEEFYQEARKWTDQYVAQGYLRGIQDVNGLAGDLGLSAQVGAFSSAPIFGSGGGDISAAAAKILSEYPQHHTMYTAFQEAAYSQLRDTRLPVVTDMNRKIRDLVVRSSERAYREADTITRRQITQEIMEELAKDNITGIVYENGRRVNLGSYAEVVARSQTGNAARQAALNRQQEYGLDLVQISQHFPCSDLCIPWQARVYSISGTSSRYPSLQEAIDGGLYHANCYDTETEVYTRDGWKLFKDVQKNDVIMSLNPDTQEPEWMPHKGLIEYHRRGDMIEMEDRSFSLCVTPDHNLYAAFSGREDGKRKWKYRLEAAGNAIQKNHHQLRSCNPSNGTTSEIHGLRPDVYAKFMGYFLSEGSVEQDKGRVVIHQHNKKHRRVIWQDIGHMGFTRQEYGFVLYDRQLCDYVATLGKCDKKYVPRELLEMDSEYIRLFLNAFLLGDGTERHEISFGTGKNHNRTYTTSSERLAEGIGEAIMRVGNYPSFKLHPRKGVDVKHKNGTYAGNFDIWYISENTRKESYHYISPSMSHKGIQAKYIDYDDMVYCLELERNHIMWVRRNGKTTWSGNCKHYQSAYIPGTSRLPDEDIGVRRNRQMYEAQQRQRQIERNIRSWKRREATAVTDEAREKARRKVRDWQARQRELLEENDFLRRRYDREQV